MLTLVLYSQQDYRWKIADFGLSAEGTSQRAQTTHYARGTPSYRAPETVKDEKYTNKVDIWAMGCILYELAFRKKAFNSDMAVLSYHFSKTGPEIPLEMALDPSGKVMLPVTTAATQKVGNAIYAMLELEPTKRPSADYLVDIFGSVDVFGSVETRLHKVVRLAQTSATHGCGVMLGEGTEGFTVIDAREGSSVIKKAGASASHAWTKFIIATPVMVNDRRLKLSRAIFRFKTGSTAFVSIVLVYDAEKQVARFDDLMLRGALQDAAWEIPNNPEVWWGVTISAQIKLTPEVAGERREDWVTFYTAAIEFI